ncbi:glycosyltransferase family 4 protein [Sinosporangium album]|uniref:glycosyltransferase family 4 protein n=1 Tax=Sinosporangium album TaxID=504805 RepID=UPI001FDF2A86|nr:glycosyltransferase family 1 protein [Sinosporangium album]
MTRYVDGLISALDRAGVDLAVACQRADTERYGHLAPSARVVAGPVSIAHRASRLAWEQNALPILAKRVGAKVIHAPYYSMPIAAGVPTVATVHDVSWFTEPAHHSQDKASFFRSATRTAIRHAARVIVPSKATRDELVRVLSADSTRLDVAYHGVDTERFRRPRADEIRRVSARLGLRAQPYVAFLGALEPRKNVPNLIRGFVRAVENLPNPPALVLAGGVHDDEVDAAVGEVPASIRVVRPGYLAFADLPGFLGGALVAAFPSRGEGFGMAVLEAMACGAPVLTTHRTALPEVGGDAVAYTEPDVDGIARGLETLLTSPDQREQLASAARARAGEFTWEASAEAHMVSYQRAIE